MEQGELKGGRTWCQELGGGEMKVEHFALEAEQDAPGGGIGCTGRGRGCIRDEQGASETEHGSRWR